MMRHVALVLVSALALVACNPNAQKAGDGANSANAGGASSVFPNLLAASYRAEGTINSGNEGHAIPVVMIRSGAKMRMEMTQPEGNIVIINNPDTHESYSIITRGGRTMAMRVDTTSTQLQNPAAMWQASMGGATPTGPCSHAGQVGTGWSHNNDAGVPQTVCVTGDGIVLWAKDGDKVTWDTTSVQRGPQDPNAFVLPPGVQVMDLGNAAAAALARAQAAQNGH